MTEINKEFGFYGTVKHKFNDPEHVEVIIYTAIRRIQQIAPELTILDITMMLNGRTGRHLADELLDIPGEITPALVLIQIAMWNKLSIKKWIMHYNDFALVLPAIDKRMLYVSAIKNEMKKKAIHKLMIEEIGCDENSAWPDPETWVNAENVPTRELEMMWQYIQQKLQTKGKK